jgi:hypothetical protein
MKIQIWKGQWVEVLMNHITKLEPKPDFFVFNAGLWGAGSLTEGVFREISATVNKTGIIPIYKTTTARNKLEEPYTHDHVGCAIIGNCLNLSWTSTLGGKDYVDGTHFRSRASNLFNYQMVQLLSEITIPDPSPANSLNLSAFVKSKEAKEGKILNSKGN